MEKYNLMKQLKSENGFSYVELIVLVFLLTIFVGGIVGLVTKNWMIFKILGCIFLGLFVIGIIIYIVGNISQKSQKK